MEPSARHHRSHIRQDPPSQTDRKPQARRQAANQRTTRSDRRSSQRPCSQRREREGSPTLLRQRINKRRNRLLSRQRHNPVSPGLQELRRQDRDRTIRRSQTRESPHNPRSVIPGSFLPGKPLFPSLPIYLSTTVKAKEPIYLSMAPSISGLIRPHKRLRKLHARAHDYAKTLHTPSEHKSHGKGSYRKLHLPEGIQAAEKGH